MDTSKFSFYRNLLNTETGQFDNLIANTLELDSLSPSMPVKTDATLNLVSSQIDLATDIKGVLPIASGGTNSSAGLANGSLMISNGGAIVEGTSYTNPTFNTVACSGLVQLYGGSGKSIATADANTMIMITSTLLGVVITIDPDSSTFLPTGSWVGLYRATNKSVSISLGAGVTVKSASPSLFIDQNCCMYLYKVGANAWNAVVLPQALGSGASPTFAGGTFTGLANKMLCTGNGGSLLPLTLVNANGCNSSYDGIGNLNVTMTQNLGTSGTPSFSSATLTGSTNQLTFTPGVNSFTIAAAVPAQNTVLSLPDPGQASATLLATAGASTISGAWTFTTPPKLSTIPNALLSTDIFNKIQSTSIANSNGCAASFSGSTLTFSMSQNLSTAGTPSFAGLTDTGLTASTLVSASSTKLLQSTTLAGTNGASLAFSGTTLTASNSQDLSTAGSPSFAGLTNTGLTANSIISCNASKQLQSTTLAGSNGVNLSFGTGTLSATLAQNLSTSGTPTFAGLIDSGLTASTLLASDASKQLQSVSITNANGTNFSFSGSTLAASMSQDLSTTGNPTFGNITMGATKTLTCDNIVGASTDLRINPHATGGTLYLGHDLTTVLAAVGVGVTNTTFEVVNTTQNMFKVAPTGVTTTLGATLDDAKGNANFSSSVTTPTVFPTAISWTPSSPYVRKTVYVQLLQTQMFNLGTPYTAVAAPGAGLAYLVLNMVYNYQFSTNPYTGGGIVYPYVGSISYTSGVPTSSTLGSVSAMGTLTGQSNNLAVSGQVNLPITIQTSTGSPFTGVGKGALYLWIEYVAINVS